MRVTPFCSMSVKSNLKNDLHLSCDALSEINLSSFCTTPQLLPLALDNPPSSCYKAATWVNQIFAVQSHRVAKLLKSFGCLHSTFTYLCRSDRIQPPAPPWWAPPQQQRPQQQRQRWRRQRWRRHCWLQFWFPTFSWFLSLCGLERRLGFLLRLLLQLSEAGKKVLKCCAMAIYRKYI